MPLAWPGDEPRGQPRHVQSAPEWLYHLRKHPARGSATPERVSLVTREVYKVVYQAVYRDPLYKRYIQQKGVTRYSTRTDVRSKRARENASKCSRIHESYSHWNPSMNVCISSHVRVPPILYAYASVRGSLRRCHLVVPRVGQRHWYITGA